MVQAKQQKEQPQAQGMCSGDASDAEEPLSNAQAPRLHTKRGRTAEAFSAELKADLRKLFEKHGAHKGYLDAIVGELGGGAFKRSRIQSELKLMGLRRGQLTDSQARLYLGAADIAEQHTGTLQWR